jgi:hypothetical protein
MGFGDGAKNWSKLIFFVIKYVVRHETRLDAFIDLSKTGMWN